MQQHDKKGTVQELPLGASSCQRDVHLEHSSLVLLPTSLVSSFCTNRVQCPAAFLALICVASTVVVHPRRACHLEQDALCLLRLFLVQEQLCAAPLPCGNALDVHHVLQLVHLLTGCQCNLCGVELPSIDGHGSQAGPQGDVLQCMTMLKDPTYTVEVQGSRPEIILSVRTMHCCSYV